MMINEEAQRILMEMMGSLPHATLVSDALATRESTGENPDGTSTPSNVGERIKSPAPQVKRGGGAAEWTPGETKLLLDYYYKCFP